jgi:hypothetical protein
MGILVGNKEWRRILAGTSREDIRMYERAAGRHRIRLGYLRLKDISFLDGTVRLHEWADGGWRISREPIPKVIHNRAIYRKAGSIATLRRLRAHGIHVFNGWNRYDKMTIQRLIARNGRLSRYLPETVPFGRNRLLRFMRRKDAFLVKPNRGSLGRGIIKLSKRSAGDWEVLRQNGRRRLIMPGEAVYPYLRARLRGAGHHLQELIPLMRVRGAPFDVRVYVQRNGRGAWQVSGMFAKIMSGKRKYLSNVAQGGRAVPLEQALRRSGTGMSPGRVKARLRRVSLRLARYLSRKLPHLADVGFDFGITRSGNIRFIEMNSRDQRYGYKLAGLHAAYRRIYANPIAYGSFLLNRAVRRR